MHTQHFFLFEAYIKEEVQYTPCPFLQAHAYSDRKMLKAVFEYVPHLYRHRS